MAKYIKNIQLPTSKGRQINPSWSFPTYQQKMSELGILILPQQLPYNKGIYLCIRFLIIIPQITRHSPLLVTSSTILRAKAKAWLI